MNPAAGTDAVIPAAARRPPIVPPPQAVPVVERPVERPVEELILTLEGVFDGASAWELRRSLEQMRDTQVRRVVLDFSRVRDFYDFGVAVLAHGLAHGGALPEVILRGLRTHQTRLFRYFGVEVR